MNEFKKKKIIERKQNITIEFWGGVKNTSAQALTLEQEKVLLQELHPQKDIRFIQQVHGNSVILQQKHNKVNFPLADGHFTHEKNIALAIRVADCVPVAIWENDTGKRPTLIALHCGWKGIHDQVIDKALNKNPNLTSIHFWIGPHIQPNRFEVQRDVFDEFDTQYHLPHINPTKRYLNLTKLVKNQIQLYCKQNNIKCHHLYSEDSAIDTGKTFIPSNNYIFSHRLGDPQRNIMLIYL